MLRNEEFGKNFLIVEASSQPTLVLVFSFVPRCSCQNWTQLELKQMCLKQGKAEFGYDGSLMAISGELTSLKKKKDHKFGDFIGCPYILCRRRSGELGEC